MILLIGLALVSCNGNGVFLSPKPTKPIKTISSQRATVEDEDRTSGGVRQNNNDGTVDTSSSPSNDSSDDQVMEEAPVEEPLALDCFDTEIPDNGDYIVDGHAELFMQEGNPSSICTLLTDAQKDTAVVQYLPATCSDCEQTIQNTWWAIQRSGYQEQFLHVLALPTTSAALAEQIQDFIEEASIPAVIITDVGAKLADELQANEPASLQPQFFAVNSLLEVDFIPGDEEKYLEIVPKAEAALLSVDSGAELTPPEPETTWDGISIKATGLIEIHSVTEIKEEGEVDVL